MHVLSVVGARPNFVALAPVHRALAGRTSVRTSLVHTGQHYDESLSEIFLAELCLPRPDVRLGVGSETHARQTAAIMTAFEDALTALGPDVVVLDGGVNSTLACALVCAQAGVRVAHVEAGLRSGDRASPEEVNRTVTDALCDIHYASEPSALTNLAREGVAADRIAHVGSVRIDSVSEHLPAARARATAARLGLDGPYGLLTLHRPGNVDEAATLARFCDAAIEAASLLPLVFPVHPRTRAALAASGLLARLEAAAPRLRLRSPMGYVDWLSLMADATAVITDSGGVQEETTWLGVPCLTARDSTDRPITVEAGTNELLGDDPAAIVPALRRILAGERKSWSVHELWDGHAAERLVDDLLSRPA